MNYRNRHEVVDTIGIFFVAIPLTFGLVFALVMELINFK